MPSAAEDRLRPARARVAAAAWLCAALLALPIVAAGCGQGEELAAADGARLQDLVDRARGGVEGRKPGEVDAALAELEAEIVSLANDGALPEGEAGVLLAMTKRAETAAESITPAPDGPPAGADVEPPDDARPPEEDEDDHDDDGDEDTEGEGETEREGEEGETGDD